MQKIKGESFSSILSESKTENFFPTIPLLTKSQIFPFFFLSLWITSLLIQILVLLFLQLILKKEDEDPDRERKKGERRC